MKSLKIMYLAIAVAVILTGISSCVSETPCKGKENLEVMCHYMAWFNRSKVDGCVKYDHWEWDKIKKHDPRRSVYGNRRDISSVYYPRIGVYNSADPDVMDYHILTAKAAGINGFVVDWYGPGGFVDENFDRLLSRAEKLDFKVSVCYEEKICFPGRWSSPASRKEALDKAISDFKYLKDKYFCRKSYWRKNGKPCALVFSSWGDWDGNGKKVFTDDEWGEIIKAAGPVEIIKQNFPADNKNIRACFAWCGDRKYTEWFYNAAQRLKQKGKLDFYIGSASPGFDDRGVWGWGDGPRHEPRLGVNNFARYWDDFAKSDSNLIQIVTWNDFEEGTVVEPTAEFGNLYLEYARKRIDNLKGEKGADQALLSLPYKWFVLKKFSGGKYSERLERAKQLIALKETQKASRILDEIEKSSRTVIPPFIGINDEYLMPERLTEEGRKIMRIMPAVCSEDNIAGEAKVSASSVENQKHIPEKAVDGVLESRWASLPKENQWLELKFPELVSPRKIAIIWEDAYAEKYQISILNERNEREIVFKEDNGKPGLKVIDIPSGATFNDLKLECLKRGTRWGFSIREFAVLKTGKAQPEKALRLELSPEFWAKDEYATWIENGFELKNRTYAAIESRVKAPFKANASVSFDIRKMGKVNFINYTFQICMFDDNGNFLGVIEPLKRKKSPGKEKIYLKDYKDKIKKNASKVSFKFWLEGKIGGFIEISGFIYNY